MHSNLYLMRKHVKMCVRTVSNLTDVCRVYTRSLVDQQMRYCESGDLKLAEMGTVTRCGCLSDARGFINVIT